MASKNNSKRNKQFNAIKHRAARGRRGLDGIDAIIGGHVSPARRSSDLEVHEDAGVRKTGATNAHPEQRLFG